MTKCGDCGEIDLCVVLEMDEYDYIYKCKKCFKKWLEED